VIGIDMTDAMIAKARENMAAAGVHNVEIRKGLIEELPVDSSSVDWVISNCVINLSPEKDKVFAELFRVLKPGGRVSISDIVVEDLPAYLREIPAMHCACIGGAISEAAYLQKMSAAGLTDARVEERVVYSASQIEGLADAEIQQLSSSCCPPSKAQIETVARQLEGKIWSGKFTARKV
jgi:ubiquinone/menaquinone biosynthesis C-methylase UbiE